MNKLWNKIYLGFITLLLVGIGGIGCNPIPIAQPAPIVAPSPTPTAAATEVVLTMGAWGWSVEQMNRILAKFHEKYPHITISYDTMTPMEYDAALAAQLKAGTAPDLFYLRSYATSRKLYERGYLEPVGDLPGLKDNFDPLMRVPWATDDGLSYGVPFIATSHGIYYNKDIFKKLNLAVPETWVEFLTAAQALKDAGYIPFSNAAGEPWTIAEIVFMNLAPNFIGGREGRLEYLTGQRCFNDERVVSAFQAVKDLAPFFPPNHDLLGYADSLQLFWQGKAAMWLGGSWDIPDFEAAKPDFEWGVFAPPPPAGQSAYITFHLDVGLGLNAASPHKNEARTFLTWVTTAEFAKLLGDELPGFFPLHRKAPTLTNKHANAFLSLNQGRGTDVRFAWEKLRDGVPDGYVLMQDGALAVLLDKQTPQEAADTLQVGLAQWFKPAQVCSQEK